MTNERFSLLKKRGYGYYIGFVDNWTGKSLDDYSLMKLANHIVEENELLKSELDESKKAHSNCDRLWWELYDEKKQLVEENERLQKDLIENNPSNIKLELDVKLDFILNLLFDIRCYNSVHYEEEALGYDLGKAEQLGFNIEPSKKWDYDKEQYEFSRNHRGYYDEYYNPKINKVRK